MLFVIDQSVIDLFAAGRAQALDVNGLDYLALGVAEGNHRIIGPRKVLLDLAVQDTLHKKTRSVINRAVNRAAQEGKLHHQLSVYGRVLADGGTVPVSRMHGLQRVISFPLRWFDSSAKIQPTVVLGEDLSDVGVLEKVGEVGTVLAGLRHLPLRLSHDHGGGSKIGVVLGSNASANRFCVCIVDSDRACPTGTLGGTAITVQSYKNPAAYPLVDVAETSGRDLENALPDVFYRTAYTDPSRHGPMVTLLEHLTQSGETDVRAHLDIEKGLTLRQVYNHPTGSPENVFWRAKLNSLLASPGIVHSSLPCLATGVCASPQNADCTCVILVGNRANILDHFIDRFGSATRYYLASCLDRSVRSEWHRLGANIASWCCGDEPLRM